MSADPPGEPPCGQPRETARTVLVVADDDELAVALRERVSRTFVVVRHLRPSEVGDGLRQCPPWPWMVIGTGSAVDPAIRGLLSTRPALCFWLGGRPATLPRHARSFARVGTLATAVARALANDVAGLRLAPGVGVELGDGRLLRSLTLQALVSAHPHPFDLPPRTFNSAARLLAREALSLRIQATPGVGTTLMVRARSSGTDAS